MADAMFPIANLLAISGWLALLASPWLRRLAERYAGLVVPGLLAIAYSALILVFWSRSEGGFGSLDEVAALFRSRELLLAGWLHYLAFDLFVGAWQVRTARQAGIPFPLVVPCLVLTFLFGPAGLFAFFALTAAFRATRFRLA